MKQYLFVPAPHYHAPPLLTYSALLTRYLSHPVFFSTISLKTMLRATCRSLFIALALMGGSCQQRLQTSKGNAASVWLTTPDKSALFQLQPTSLAFNAAADSNPIIEVDDAQTFQTMDGFGYCLTGGSAMLLHRMSAPERAKLLRELFATDGTNIGVSYLRVSIGASDLDDRVFSYDDLPAGQTDPTLARFSLAPDQEHLIPVLKEILAISPKLKILGSPWSPPTWMKTNANSKGGSLKPEFYDAYAQYFVKYIQGMKAAGIRIDAITVQNEPLHPGNNPSLLMLAEQQAEFIRKSLGPAFRTAKLDTKIIAYDHNADRPDYPITVLNDKEARQYVDGSAFHLYAGPIEALSKVHDAHPDKNVYFTEQWIGAPGKFPGDLAWHTKTLIIGATRNWARTVLEWNLAADPQQNPHTPGGCTECLGAVTLADNTVTRNPAYYIIAHASKFVRPGSVRIASTTPASLPNVAFRAPDGNRVVIVHNEGTAPQTFTIRYQGKLLRTSLVAGAVGTYVW
jgi:glucosylceramidase